MRRSHVITQREHPPKIRNGHYTDPNASSVDALELRSKRRLSNNVQGFGSSLPLLAIEDHC